MAALDTVADYIADARVLLQDQAAPYRYEDTELVENLNLGLLEFRRLRPDLMFAYLNSTIPSYSAYAMTTAVAMDVQYRMALLYYICGQAQLRDEETTQDARATAFLQKFTAQLLTPEA
jgi:hypothetical protein